MDATIENAIQQIHSTPFQLVLYETGGGSQAIPWLLSVPGASRTVLEVKVPYATSSLTSTLGFSPSSFASLQTAQDLAKAALQQAANLSPFGTKIIGVGVTCALATDRQRAGQHKIFVATTDGSGKPPSSTTLILSKNTRSRVEEDVLASRAVLASIAKATGVVVDVCGDDQIVKPYLVPEDVLTMTNDDTSSSSNDDKASRAINAVISGTARCVEFSGGKILVDCPREGRMYLPGSFNPLHAGHMGLLDVAVRKVSENSSGNNNSQQSQHLIEGAFELSIGNADKGFLSVDEVKRRLAQFTSRTNLPVVVTKAPLFTQKAQLFPSSTFVVGHDTAERLLKPEYYGNSRESMALQFAALAGRKCQFIVAGRRNAKTGQFEPWDDVVVPQFLEGWNLFQGIAEEEFRADISSTDLRNELEQHK
jgi:nicotinic acid mononucleotide adenylyltransferase